MRVEGASAEFVLAVDLGGTHLRAAAIDHQGTIHSSLKQDTPSGNADEIVRALVSGLQVCAKQLKDRTPGATAQIKAVCVAVPGTVDVATGVVLKAPNLVSLDGFPLAAAVASELELPATLENDANAAAVGEMWMGVARELRSIVCVTLGTGVGGGIILDGQLWRGANGSAAEVGHMCVDPFEDAICGCGSRGCLEAYASATALVRMTREIGAQNSHSKLHTLDELTSEKIYQAGLAGDEVALEAFRRMGSYLGIGISNLLNLLDPEIIVIGGGVAKGWALFEQAMHKEVSERAFLTARTLAKIVPAECGDDAGLLGAARLAFQLKVSDKL